MAAFTSAPSSIARTNRGRASRASSARNAGLPVAAPSPARPAGIPFRMPRAAGRQRAATAQKAARQPSHVPSTAPPGTPATVATVVPDSSTASARPFLSGATSVAAAVRATARKPAFASAATTRVANRVGKFVVTAPTTCAAAKTSTNTRRAARLGQSRASAATRGAPTTMPTAKAEVRAPAVATVTSRSEAMSGKRPASMNSEVPMAKTARASRYSGRGIEWLRGERNT